MRLKSSAVIWQGVKWKKQGVVISWQGVKTKKARSIGEKAVSKEELLLAFCSEPRSLSEISEFLKLKEKYKMKKKLIDPLLGKSLRMTEPNSPNSQTQKYVIIGNDD